LLVNLEKEIIANPDKYSSKGKPDAADGREEANEGDCMRNSVNLVKLIKSQIAATDKELITAAINAGSPSGMFVVCPIRVHLGRSVLVSVL
jgi:hypothetical protein